VSGPVEGGGGGKPVIGLLGGVGSGKSAVASELADLGCAVLDADRIGHEVLAEPEVRAELRRWWGDCVIAADGSVDRPAVADIVFADPAERARLNDLTHPRIHARLAERVAALRADPACPAVVIDAALLLETRWHELCTVFLFVDAPAEVRARRVAARGWDRDEWARRENAQKPLDKKAARAEYVLDNSSSLPYLRQQVRSVFQRIIQATG
jgi:dephospho-CoA kinase